MKSVYSKQTQYEKFVGKTLNYLKIKQLLTENSRWKFEAECICGKVFYPRCESVTMQTGCNPTKSCGCKRYDLVSENNKTDNGPTKELMKNYQFSANKRNLSFNLTYDDFKLLLSKECFYCGSKPIEHRIKKAKQGKRRDRFLLYNGIDRIANTIGYTLSNCVSCCKTCNIAKSTLTKNSFLAWIYQVAKHSGFIVD